MTVRRLSAATACILAAMLAACGTDQTPGPSTSTTASAPTATATPPSTTPVDPSPSTPSSSSSSTVTPAGNDPAARRAQAKTVTSEFMQSAFTVGYPTDRDLDTYLRRIQPLLTPAGYAQEVSLYRSDPSVGTTIEGYYDQHRRVTIKITSGPEVVEAGTVAATTTVKYHILSQQQVDGNWHTSSTGPEKTETVSLANANDDGVYLVDRLS